MNRIWECKVYFKARNKGRDKNRNPFIKGELKDCLVILDPENKFVDIGTNHTVVNRNIKRSGIGKFTSEDIIEIIPIKDMGPSYAKV